MRKVAEASDEHGCVHSGILELKALSKQYLRFYVEEDGWLYRKPCKDCAAKDKVKKEAHHVLEMSSLLTVRGKQDVGYYCNCGATGFQMEESNEIKELYTCDMVLCNPCFSQRVEKIPVDGRNQRSKRSKKR